MKETFVATLAVVISVGPPLALTGAALLLLFKATRRFKWNTWPSAIAVWTSALVAIGLVSTVTYAIYEVWGPVIHAHAEGTHGLILLLGPLFMSAIPIAATAAIGAGLFWWAGKLQGHEPQQGVPADRPRPAGEAGG